MVTAVATLVVSTVSAIGTVAQAYFQGRQVSSDSVKPPKIEKQGGPDITNFGEPGKKIKEILDELERSSNFKTIVILGKMGFGKTTMMRNLNDHAKVAKKFDIVIWLKVSLERSWENFSREHLQQLIVARLKLDIGGSNNIEVGKKISMELQGKRYLLLLDDVKQYLNLEDIGIPKSNNGSKIVLTTRSNSVCAAFDTDMKIEVARLSEKDAWQMFQDVLKQPKLLKDKKIEKLAFQVCKECSGVPLLIEKVAKTFKLNNTEYDWIGGLNSWTTWWPNQECQGIREVFDFLKFCYPVLGKEQNKKCFLYGALYPEDSVINADHLLECWAAENLLGENKSITKELLIYGHQVLRSLKNVSLLEEGKSENHVKMDKFNRQLALYIAEGDHKGEYIMETSKGLTNASEEKYWTEKNIMISFGDNELKQLPASPNCSKLSTLFLQKNSSLKEIPQSFFDQMEQLRVLDVSHTGINELPSSPKKKIGRLKVLYLNNCENLAELPAQFVEKIEDLEALDVVGSGVNNIPSHIERLTKLRRLRISFSQFGVDLAEAGVVLPRSRSFSQSGVDQVEAGVVLPRSRSFSQSGVDPAEAGVVLPRSRSLPVLSAPQKVNFNFEIISKLSKLEVLVIDMNSPEKWSIDVIENIIKEVAVLKEFKSLKFCFPAKVVDVINVIEPQNLCIRVPDATMLLSFIKNVQGIRKFEFYIGCRESEHPKLPNFHKYEKYVKYCEFEGRNSPILMVLAEADAFELVDSNKIKQLSDKELESMKSIRSCLIESCGAIETIVGTSNSVVLPNLEHLFIKNLPMLKSILRGPLQPGSLPLQPGSLTKLTTLELTGCRSLDTVFPPGSIQQLCEIQCLKIEKCDAIVKIIDTSTDDGILLPKLKKMILLDMENLKIICANKTFWPSLEELEIFRCPGLLKLPFNKDNAENLKCIDADPEWWGKLQFDQNNKNKEWLQKFRNLRYPKNAS